MITQDTINRIYESIRIESIVSDFVELEQRGANLTGLCPFHNEKTPSFTVSPAKGIYKCFGCGKGGNALNFIQDHLHKSFPEAIRFAAEKLSIPIDEEKQTPAQVKISDTKKEIIEFNNRTADYFHKQLFLPENALVFEYVLSRFSKSTIDKWKIGFAPAGYTTLYNIVKEQGFKDPFLIKTGLITKSKKNNKFYDFFQNRIMFPVWDINNKIISFSGRINPSETDKNQAKYFNLKETIAYNKSAVLYGLNFAVSPIANSKTAVLVEGNPDCVKLHELGISNVIAPSGTALAQEQIKLMDRFADRIILLYDGDSAGQTALNKNGKLLVNSGLIPYAAVLPKDQDPDSFFKSEEHYSKWVESNKQDFISWYSNNLFSKIQDDPSLKNDAINEIATMLMNVNIDTRKVYVDEISRNSKVRTKLFSDRFKELEALLPKKQTPKKSNLSASDAIEFDDWGFYVKNNCYQFRTKSGTEELSNFIMKPIFHIDTVNDSKRIYELVNKHGFSVVVNLDMQEMTSLQGFQRNVESKGNFMFWGQMQNFQKLKLKLYEETRTCQEIKNLGWQKEGFWSWANGMINQAGEFVPIDEYGVVNYNDQDFFIPAFSKIYLKDKSIFIDERKFQYRKTSIDIKTWMDLFLKVHGDNAMIGFAWYISALFRDHILYLNDNFPLLNLFGQKGSGKNTLAYSLLSLFGKKQTEFNIHNGTKPGLAKHLEMFSNAIAFIDEYKNSLEFDKIETLKSIYNAIGRSRLNMDKGGKKETTEVNQAVIVAGQEMPTIDVALSSRMIFLQFLSKEGLSKEAKSNFEQLQQIERDGLPHITVEILKHRKYFIEHFKVNYDAVMRDLIHKTSKEQINDRLLRNICTVIASFKTLESKFNFSFDYYALLNKGLSVTIAHNKQINQSDEIGVFWSLFEAMFDDNILINKWHFRVRDLEHLTTTNRKLSFQPEKKVLKFKFNAIAKLYAEHLRRRGEKPLPQDSLNHYLQTSKHFLGVERSCRFSRKDWVQSEAKVIKQTQTTSAFCFDYSALGINLERDDYEVSKNENNSGTTEAPKDSLKF